MSAKAHPFAPTLHTQRLELRLFNLDDPTQYDQHLAILNSPTTISAMGDFGIRTHAQYRQLIGSTLPSAALLSNPTTTEPVTQPLIYNIHARRGPEQETFLGVVSLARRSASLPPDLGWMIAEQFTGRGYASEAAGRLLEYVRSELGVREVMACPRPENVASVKVALKVGFVEGGEIWDGENAERLVVYVLPGMKRLEGSQTINLSGEYEDGVN